MTGEPATRSSPLPVHPGHLGVTAWGAMAAINLLAGVVLALRPERQVDFLAVVRWSRLWLVDGVDLCTMPQEYTDYPPHALVALSPLAVLPDGWAAPLWMVVNVALCAMVPVLALRIAPPPRSPSVRPVVARAGGAVLGRVPHPAPVQTTHAVLRSHGNAVGRPKTGRPGAALRSAWL